MTSDAKVGLLLGLVFIFIIAFIINGLPKFGNDKSNSELTITTVTSRNGQLGIATRERNIINQARRTENQSLEIRTPPAEEQDIRFAAPLPGSTAAESITRTVAADNTLPKPSKSLVIEQPAPKAVRTKKLRAKIYRICDGDTLATIAKKFYGPNEGNKRAIIDAIFRANKKALKSANEIYPGQKLLIPALRVYESTIDSVLSPEMFEKAKSVGAIHILPKGRLTKRHGQYTVQDGDSLWKIAAEKLGNGNRYAELARLNADILEDEDSLPVGTRIRIPVQ